MIRFMLCDEKAESGGAELLERTGATDPAAGYGSICRRAAASETGLLVDQLGLDEHAVQGPAATSPSGFEAYPDYIYLLTKPLTSDSEDLDFSTQQVGAFTGPHLLVTRHNQYSRFINTLLQRFTEQVAGESPPASPLRCRVADRYGKVPLDLEHRLDEVVKTSCSNHAVTG